MSIIIQNENLFTVVGVSTRYPGSRGPSELDLGGGKVNRALYVLLSTINLSLYIMQVHMYLQLL